MGLQQALREFAWGARLWGPTGAWQAGAVANADCGCSGCWLSWLGCREPGVLWWASGPGLQQSWGKVA